VALEAVKDILRLMIAALRILVDIRRYFQTCVQKSMLKVLTALPLFLEIANIEY